MKWYAAHIIVYTKFMGGSQDKYPVWENIVLIKASSEEIAYEEAERIGKRDYDQAGGVISWEDRPAMWVFAGVRKLIECSVEDNDSSIGVGHGTEVSYSQFILDSEETLTQIVNGDPVHLIYEE